MWPENWSAVQLFIRLDTQWRYSFNGREGLDHNVLFRHLDNMGLSPEEWGRWFDEIRIMELTALEAMTAT